MDSRTYSLIVGVLGVWRLTHLLNAEDGPGSVLVRLRALAGSGFWGTLLDCFYCLSIWIAAPFALGLGVGWSERWLLWPALSAGAILLERATASAHAVEQPAEYSEDRVIDGEIADELLRREETPSGHEG